MNYLEFKNIMYFHGFIPYFRMKNAMIHSEVSDFKAFSVKEHFLQP